MSTLASKKAPMPPPTTSESMASQLRRKPSPGPQDLMQLQMQSMASRRASAASQEVEQPPSRQQKRRSVDPGQESSIKSLRDPDKVFRSEDPGLIAMPANLHAASGDNNENNNPEQRTISKTFSDVSGRSTSSERLDQVFPLPEKELLSSSSHHHQQLCSSSDHSKNSMGLDGSMGLEGSNSTIPISNRTTTTSHLAPPEFSSSAVTVPVRNKEGPPSALTDSIMTVQTSNVGFRINNNNNHDMSSSIPTTGIHAPVPHPMEDMSLDELFTSQMNRSFDNGHAKHLSDNDVVNNEGGAGDRNKDSPSPSQPPVQIGFETMPASPQRQTPPATNHAPWEMPPTLPNMPPDEESPTEDPLNSKPSASRAPPPLDTACLEQDDDEHVSATRIAFRAIFVLLVIAIVVLSVIFLRGDGGDDDDDIDFVVTASPTSSVTSNNSTTRPTDPTSMPTPAPTGDDFLDFEYPIAPLESPGGSRGFGRNVAMNAEGTMLVGAGESSDDPIEVFAWQNETWIFHSTVEFESMAGPLSVNSALDFVSPTLDGDGDAEEQQQQQHILAIASSNSIRVLQYVSDEWISMGPEVIFWRSENSTIVPKVSSAVVRLSQDGRVLAVGSLNEAGYHIIVRIFEWDGDRWEQQGNSIISSRSDSEYEFLGMAMDLSGDGTAFAMADWTMEHPQSTAEVYQNVNGEWTPQGKPLKYNYGPAALSLSYGGERLGVTVRYPGVSGVLEWSNSTNTTKWSPVGGAMIIGGDSITLSGDGNRVMIGDPGKSSVLIYDLLFEKWTPVSRLDGKDGSLFGASIDMSDGGSVFAIGAPRNNTTGDEGSASENMGTIFVYQL